MRLQTILSAVLLGGLLFSPGHAAETGTAPPAAAASNRSVTVELTSGRRFTADVDSRTDRFQLWLSHRVPSGLVLRPVDWARVVRVELGGDVFSGEEFRNAVDALRQAFPRRPEADSARSPLALGPAEGRRDGQAPARQGGSGTHAAPAVQSLAVEARPANWDGDVEVDGLLVTIVPLDARGTTVPVRGTLEVTLIAERVGVVRRPQPFARLGRWTQLVRPEDFGPYGADYRLPFQSVHPEFDARWAAFGAVHARLSVPGHGVFEQTASTVRIRPYSAVRDQLEQVTGRRFFESERIGRGPRS